MPKNEDAPAVRFGHSATAVGSKIIIFAGRGSNKLLNDLAVYDTETCKWVTKQKDKKKNAIIEARSGHTALLLSRPNQRDQVLIFGGYKSGNRYSNGIYLLDPGN
jgi:hypothetical protein